MKQILFPVILLGLFAAALTGCSNASRTLSTGLRVELTNLERTADGSVSVSWHVANSNVVSYLLSSTSHKIYLNGVYLGSVVDGEPLGVPANANTGRTSKVAGVDAAAKNALTAALAKGSADYRVNSQIVVRIYDETTEKSQFTSSGTVPVTAK